MKILIVERDITLLETMRDICNDEGHEALMSTSCDQARLLLKKETPDIIFCAQFMPQNHGIHFRDELSSRKDIRFILMNSVIKPDEKLKENELNKPFSMEELIHFLRSVRPS